MSSLNPKKLLLTKWTAVTPIAKQKHFLVSRVIQPEQPTDPIEAVEIEAVFFKPKSVKDNAALGRSVLEDDVLATVSGDSLNANYS